MAEYAKQNPNQDAEEAPYYSALRRRTALTAMNLFNTIVVLLTIALIALNKFTLGVICLTWLTFSCACMICLKKGKHIKPVAMALAYSMVFGNMLSQYINSGADWPSYAITPALVITVICLLDRAQAFWSTSIIIATMCISIYSAGSIGAPTIVIPEDLFITAIAPSFLFSSAVVYFLFSSYQVANKETLMNLKGEQEKSAENYSKLKNSLARQQVLSKIQMHLQHVGNLSGWWVDIAAKQLSINVRHSNGKFEVCQLPLNDQLNLQPEEGSSVRQLQDVQIWLKVVLPQLENALANEDAWDIECSPDLGTQFAHKRWFRSIGEIEYDDQANPYVFGVIQDITASKSMTRRLEYQSHSDDLTGLYNRRYIEEQLNLIITDDNFDTQPFYLFIDLDRFKTVNDTSGHVAGDELLRVLGKIIQGNISEKDVVGRVGGDEYAVILSDSSEDNAINTANKIRKDIESFCFSWQGSQHRIGATIGAVKIDNRIESKDHLQLLADTACLQAKSEGRNRVKLTFGDSDAAIEKRENSRWLQRIQDALQNDQFALFAQKIKQVDKPSSARNAYEVLLRMRTTDSQDLIAPGAFLPTAERFNLSAEIDNWVVEKVIDIATNQAKSSNTHSDMFWVNLSGQSIGNKLFADSLVETIANAELPESTINFEITETAVIGDMEVAITLMQRLRALGCLFALDDFGAGLSSFGYLKKLPVDVIKIDGMFIREIDVTAIDRAFTKSIIEVAHSIGIKTVAEFVENDKIRETVTDLGIDYLQGFGIHRPEEIENTTAIDLLAAS